MLYWEPFASQTQDGQIQLDGCFWFFIWKGLSSPGSMLFHLQLSNQNFFYEKSLAWKSSNRWKVKDYRFNDAYTVPIHVKYMICISWQPLTCSTSDFCHRLNMTMMTFFHVLYQLINLQQSFCVIYLLIYHKYRKMRCERLVCYEKYRISGYLRIMFCPRILVLNRVLNLREWIFTKSKWEL